MDTLFFLIAGFVGAATIASEEPERVSLRVLSARLNSMALRHDHGENQADRERLREELKDSIAESTNNIRVLFTVRVTQITWEGGVARIGTQSEFTKRKKTPPVMLKRPHTFKVKLEQDEAAAIKPRTALKVNAVIEFIPSKSHTPFAKNLLWTVTTTKPPSPVIGYYRYKTITLKFGERTLTNVTDKE